RKTGGIAGIKFSHQVGPVHLDSLETDSQTIGDFLGYAALPYHQQDLSFPSGNLLAENALLLMKYRIIVMVMNRLVATDPAGNGGKQFICGERFWQIVVSPFGHPTADIGTVTQGSNKDEGDIGKCTI